MTNETTASQPILMAYVATDLDGHADVGLTIESAKHRAGPGCDTIIALHDISAQFVELEGKRVCAPADVLASQPKSIGDDARDDSAFLAHWDSTAHEYGADAFGVAYKAARAAWFAAPAAQASATIQAEFKPAFGLYAVVNEMVAHIGMCGEIDARHDLVEKVMDELHKLDGGNVAQRVDDLVEKAFMPKDQATKLAVEEYCHKADAATIQEPVMVAEPVEEGWPTNAMISAGFKAGLSGKIGSGFRAMQAAAPMVADPAGVARNDALDEAAALVMGCDKRADPRGIACAIRLLKSDPAATVKAVPSEALDEIDKGFIESAVNILFRCGYSIPAANLKSVSERLSFAAPLADKTGGGDHE